MVCAKLQNITVVYSAGYSDSEGTAENVPKDMKYVCARASGKLIVTALIFIFTTKHRFCWY